MSIFAVVVSVLTLMAGQAFAGEEPEHYHLMFVMARAAGFNFNDAHLIASSSWAPDANLDTTAFEMSREIPGRIQNLERGFRNLGHDDEYDFAQKQLFSKDGNFRYAAQGKANHALGSEEARTQMRRYWEKTIDGAQDRGERLLLTGMYLHFLVDTHVHPNESTLGHAAELHMTDRAIFHTREFSDAAVEAFGLLNKTYSQVNQDSEAQSQRVHAMGLDDPARLRKFSEHAVYSISEAYRRAGALEYGKGWWKENIVSVGQVTQRLQTDLAKDFAPVGKLAIPQPGQIQLTRQNDGTLSVQSTTFKNQLPASIQDPVAAVQARPELAAVKNELTQEVHQTVHDVGLTAAAMAISTKDETSALVTTGKQLAEVEYSSIRQAVSTAATSEIEAGKVVVRWSKERGLESVQKLKDGTYRLIQITENGLRIIEGIGSQAGAKVYELSLEAAQKILAFPDVGGVKLGYSADMLASLGSVTGADHSSVMKLDGSIRLVSLKALGEALSAANGNFEKLDEATRSLGGISRINGYVLNHDQGDVVLIGRQEPNSPHIRADELVMGLQSVYRDGLEPAVSIDPAPGQANGPHYSKVFGLPRTSRFARILLDADYTMKKIQLGAVEPKIQDFESYASLYEQNPTPTTSRFWLTPVRPGSGDIHFTPEFDTVLFTNRVQTLTENALVTGTGLQGTGTTDPLAEQAAASFSKHYGEIANQYPIFHQLEGLADIVLTATVLRSRHVTEPALESLITALSPVDLLVPSTFSGLQKIIKVVPDDQGRQHIFTLFGGAKLKNRIEQKHAASFADRQIVVIRAYARELSRSGNLALDTNLNSLAIASSDGQNTDFDKALDEGMQQLELGGFEAAIAHFNEVIAADEGLAEGYALRGQANAALNNYELALADILKARDLDPSEEDYQVLEGQLRIEHGDTYSLDTLSGVVRTRIATSLMQHANECLSYHQAKRALKLYELAIQVDEKNARVYLARASFNRIFGRNREAESDADTAMRLDDTTAVEAYTIKATIAFTERNFEKLLIYSDSALKLDPRAPVYDLRCGYFFDDSQYEKAIEACSWALEISSGDSVALNIRGRVFYIAERWQQAAEDLYKAIILDPSLEKELGPLAKDALKRWQDSQPTT